MFCPDCGTENARGQKFCTRCGNNLMALEHARTVVNEVAGSSTSQLEAGTVMKIVALVSILGLFFVTAGTIALLAIETAKDGAIQTPMPILFGLGGLLTVLIICRYLLNLIKSPTKTEAQYTKVKPTQPPLKPTTNRSLGEGDPHFSVTEQPTQQFDPQRRAGQ